MSLSPATPASQARTKPFAGALSSRMAPYLLAAAVYLVVICGYFGSLLAHPDSRVLVGMSDAALAIRGYDVAAAAGSTPFTFRHDRLNGAPEGLSALPQTQIAQPVQPAVIWAFRGVVGTVAVVNLFLLSGVFLTALAGFALLWWARLGMLSSLFGGFVMAFNPWMVERAISGHIAFMHGWTLIVLLAALTKLRAARTLRWAALAGLAFALCFLFAAYLGLLATALVLAFVVTDLTAQRLGWESLWTFTLLLVLGAVAMLAFIPGGASVALDSGNVATGLSHNTEALQQFGAKPEDYVLPVSRHPLLGSAGQHRHAVSVAVFHERDVFVGFAVLALAILTVIRLVRGRLRLPEGVARNLVVLAGAAVPIAFVASMQRQLSVGGIEIPMPSYWIGEVTTFYRVYARLGYIVELGLAVLAAAALYTLLRGSRRQYALACVLVAVTVFEFLPGTLSALAIGKPPAYDAWLAQRPPGIAAHYPMMTDAPQTQELAASELYYQRFTLQPLYERYGSERTGTREDAVRLMSRDLRSEDALGILAAEGVRYVVVHDDVYRSLRQKPPKLRAGVKHLRTFGSVRVYEVTTKPIDLTSYLKSHAFEIAKAFGLDVPAVTFGNGFYAPEKYLDYTTPFRWMRGAGDVTVENAEGEPTRVWLDGLGFSNGIQRRLILLDAAGHRVASADVPPQEVSIRFGPIRLPPGTSHFRIIPVPGPTPMGGGDPRVASVYLSDLRETRKLELRGQSGK